MMNKIKIFGFKIMLMLAIVVFGMGMASAGDVSVTAVTAQLRSPLNGLVDISVVIKGAAEDVSEYECVFVATNSATKSTIPIVHVNRNGSDSESGSTWTRKYVWDAKADIGAVKIDDIALNVMAELLYVQLWENGPYWAKCNLGATKPEESGYYFWWGDIVGYKRNAKNNGWVSVKDSSSFSFNTENCSTYGNDNAQLQSAGYIDATGNLVAAYDAAKVHLGVPWRMPTDAEFSLLISNCKTIWTTRNGVKGCLVTGKGLYSLNSIFLPAVGSGFGDNLNDIGMNGFYWSSTAHSLEPNLAWDLYFESNKFYMSGNNRRNGRSVRPVRDSAASSAATGSVTTHFAFECLTVDPIPELPPSASADEVRAALEGSVDAKLQENITDAAVYGQYRGWAMKIGAESVKDAANSWISFAVDSAALLEKVPVDGDLKIEEFKPVAAEGAFDFTVSVKDVVVGSGATDANLKKVFGLGGTTQLGTEEFDPDKVALEFGSPVNGKLKFTASPKDKTAKSFFMKMKVK